MLYCHRQTFLSSARSSSAPGRRRCLVALALLHVEVGQDLEHVERVLLVDALERGYALSALPISAYARTKSFFDARFRISCFLSFFVAWATWKNVSSASWNRCRLRWIQPILYIAYQYAVDLGNLRTIL
jgi:hypothetical protein